MHAVDLLLLLLALFMMIEYALALVFASAAVQKARKLQHFANFLTANGSAGARRAAHVVVTVEVVIALSMAIPTTAIASAFTAAVFLCAATAFVAHRYRRSDPVECHCWGGSPDDNDTNRDLVRPAWIALRNGVLLASALTVAGWSLERAALAALVPIAFVAAGLVGSIAAGRRDLRRPLHPRVPKFYGRLIEFGHLRVVSVHDWLPASDFFQAAAAPEGDRR